MVRRTLLIALFLLSSCANLSKNQVLNETFDLRGGKFANQAWDSSLVFERTSWYTELTLVYDLLLTRIDATSPFWQWLSTTEKQSISSCSKHYVVVAYSQASTKISHGMFKQFAREAGYRSFALPQFSNYLELHPDFAQNSFHLYKVFGLCLEQGLAKRDDMAIQFPNFKEVVLKQD